MLNFIVWFGRMDSGFMFEKLHSLSNIDNRLRSIIDQFLTFIR